MAFFLKSTFSPGAHSYTRYQLLLFTFKRVIVTPAVYPRLVEFLHFDIQSTGQKSLCVNTFWGHHKALFLLNSRIPRVRFSSELTVNYARKGRNHPCRSHKNFNGPLVTSQSKEIDIFTARPLCPVLRANPFPEVTDLICRIPLSTLFYRPEAANLGDLMRLWVRPDRIGSPYLDFQGSSWASLTVRW